MGYLVDTAHPLNYQQTKSLADYIKKHGIIQFLNLYKKFQDYSSEDVYWGDEIELHLLNIDPKTKLPKLQLNTEYMFESLTSDVFDLQPEYGAWMLEAVPLKPYESTGDPNALLENFKNRRETIKSFCQEGDVLFAGTVFPMLEVGDFFVPKLTEQLAKGNDSAREEEEKNMSCSRDSSVLGSDFKYELLNPHPRYSVSCENIAIRRGEKVCMLVPIYPDEKTPMNRTKDEPYPGFIHMNKGLFGTGNTSLQVTFGTRNVDEARYLADQIAVFSSIVLPLSAASVVFKGKLADVDIRWNVLCDSVDCRTKEERDETSPNYRPKPRWSTTSRYISNRPQCKEEYNDITLPLEEEIMKFAKDKAKDMDIDLDDALVKHLGFLFLQDPVVAFADKIYVDDSKTTNHFENLQSTNWNNVRFKPPPSFDSEIGWRVELRTIEAQLTADESVAFGMFSYFFNVLVTRREYNFYIPISKIDENIARAHKKDAVLTEKFWFRKDIQKDSADEWAELTLDEILHGKPDTFVGLFNLIFDFCKQEYGVDMQAEWTQRKENNDTEIHKVTENMKYFEILSKRAKGEMPTIANWSRNYILKHPKYQKDSVVSHEIAADLINAMLDISDGKKTYADFM